MQSAVGQVQAQTEQLAKDFEEFKNKMLFSNKQLKAILLRMAAKQGVKLEEDDLSDDDNELVTGI